MHKPNLLILDEPTNGLDPEGIKEMRELLVKLAKEENMGILISSHNLSELESFCNKVCIIKNGEIVETSNMEDAKKIEKGGSYIFQVDNSKIAKLVLEGFSYKNKIIDGTTIKIHAEKEKIPNIVQKLVEKEIKIYEVREEKISLEDAFLKKTGGNVID